MEYMAQNMPRAETRRKASLRKEQQFAGISSPYLEKVLDAGLAQLASIYQFIHALALNGIPL
jgi:hypothetical protein